MATVPGEPMDAGMLPPSLQPTQGDLLMAAAIMHQQGKFAMDTSGMRPSTNVEDVRARGPAAPPSRLDELIEQGKELPPELARPFRSKAS
jgi:hypothetical protein